MRAGLYLIAAGILLLGIGIGIGVDRHWLGQDDTVAALPAGETVEEHARTHENPVYVCPMHPDVVMHEPGSCPVCGMALVSREPLLQKDSPGGSLPEVAVPPGFIHNFGVRTARVERGPVSREILAIGRVARMPQPKVTDVTPGLKGKILSVNDKELGDTVSKDEWLYSVDTPAWRALQQNYLDALQDEDPTRAVQLRQRLQSLGMKPAALSRLSSAGQIEEVVTVSEVSGVSPPAVSRDKPEQGSGMLVRFDMHFRIVHIFDGAHDHVDVSFRIVAVIGKNKPRPRTFGVLD